MLMSSQCSLRICCRHAWAPSLSCVTSVLQCCPFQLQTRFMSTSRAARKRARVASDAARVGDTVAEPDAEAEKMQTMSSARSKDGGASALAVSADVKNDTAARSYTSSRATSPAASLPNAEGAGDPEISKTTIAPALVQNGVFLKVDESQQQRVTQTQSNGRKPGEKKGRKPGLPTEPIGVKYNVSMRPDRLTREEKIITVMSWNVAGLRGLMRKDCGAISRLLEAEDVDVLCLQEHKLQEKHVDETIAQLCLSDWEMHCICSQAKAGYSGVAVLFKRQHFPSATVSKGIGSDDHDLEGRVITLHLPEMHIVNTYVPNSGEGLKRLSYRIEQWDPALAAHMEKLRAGGAHGVLATGDFNCARHEIDIHNARNNVKSAGFTPEERASFQKVYMDAGWIDSFREQHPGVHGYTYYSYRQGMRNKQKGWRLDYVLLSADLAQKCHDSFILPEFLGSDHCPLGVTLRKAAVKSGTEEKVAAELVDQLTV